MEAVITLLEDYDNDWSQKLSGKSRGQQWHIDIMTFSAEIGINLSRLYCYKK
jgi:hypothetical protein